jgi:hypothetical protein
MVLVIVVRITALGMVFTTCLGVLSLALPR